MIYIKYNKYNIKHIYILSLYDIIYTIIPLYTTVQYLIYSSTIIVKSNTVSRMLSMSKPTRRELTTRQKNNESKSKSNDEEMKEESFIYGVMILLGIPLELKRKVKKTKEEVPLQRFIITKVMNADLENEIERRMDEWKLAQEGTSQRQQDKSRQNITLNVLLELLEQCGQIIERKNTKTATKTVKRERIKMFNDLSQTEILEIGEKLCSYFIDTIPFTEKRNRNETKMVINKIPEDISII